MFMLTSVTPINSVKINKLVFLPAVYVTDFQFHDLMRIVLTLKAYCDWNLCRFLCLITFQLGKMLLLIIKYDFFFPGRIFFQCQKMIFFQLTKSLFVYILTLQSRRNNFCVTCFHKKGTWWKQLETGQKGCFKFSYLKMSI